MDWLNFGTPVTTPQDGDVVVFDWSKIGSSGHHVAFYLADAGDRISVIGGNQSNSVSITTYAKAAVLGYRRAHGMNEVRVAFSSSPWLGALIKEFTGGDVNHAFFIFYDPVFDAQLTLGANANGLTIEHLDKFDGQIVHIFEPTDPGKGLEMGLRRDDGSRRRHSPSEDGRLPTPYGSSR